MPTRRTRLSTVGNILLEMGKLFREARDGKLPWVDAGIGVRMLREIRLTLECVDFDKRLSALEEQRGIRRPNGSASLYRPGSRPS